jgi:hypothetical protein
MLDNFAVVAFVGIWFASSLPQAAALKWEVCTTNEAGARVCRARLPKSAQIAIGVCSLGVVLILIVLVICILRNRRKAAVDEQEYNVEASQVQGPPTIIATEYHPTSGPAGVISGGGRMSPDMNQTSATAPSFPVPMYHPSGSQHNHTAPVSQAAFSDQHGYPFTGMGSQDSPHQVPNAPKTAFVTGGFPRPLLAGHRLKDRLKERPASASSLSVTPPPSR